MSGRNGFQVEQYPFEALSSVSFLFNKVSYLREYPTDDLVRFIYSDRKPLWSLVGIIKQRQLQTVPWATFGGIQQHSTSALEVVEKFIELVVGYCISHDIQAIKLRMPPSFYLQSSTIEKSLVQAGFRVDQEDVNQHIEIGNNTYSDIISYNELKKLKKSVREGYEFTALEPSQLPEVYELIKVTRQRRGFPISMQFESLKKMFDRFPSQFKLFGIVHGQRLIAAAVSIHISDTSLYNFYHGDDEEYRVFSPIVQLLEGIYRYCQFQNIRTLDLGISTDKGEMNEGLYRFKKNCGAIESPKRIWSLQI